MKKIQYGILISSLLLAGGPSTSFAMYSNDTTEECTSTQTARDLIREQVLDFQVSDFGQRLSERANSGDIVLVIGDPVSVNASLDHSDFGKSRDLAFSRSFLNTQSKFILLQNRNIQTEIINDRFDQEPSNEQMSFKEGETDGDLWRLNDKLFRLTEAKLDAALAEEGVPANEYQSLNPKKKVDLYRESLTRKTVQRAAERVAGLLPIMNFEASDCDGRVAVSTVAVFSQKTLDFTTAFINGKAFQPDSGKKASKPINQQILEEIASDEVVDLWGLRKVTDESGYPALISYGQWSYLRKSGSTRANERKEDSALIQAQNNALQQMALFLNGTASTVISTEIEEFVNEFVELEKTQDGVIESTQVVDEIVERTLSKSSARANVRLTGVSSPITWVKPYPNKASAVQLVGAVMYWTPTTSDAVSKATGNPERRAAGAQQATESSGKKPAGTDQRKSKVKNNARDF